jgi:hypothetical protein
MLELHTTTANTFVISKAVSEAVAYTLSIEGLTLLKTESGGINNDIQVYYFSNSIGHLLPYSSFDLPNFNVKLLFLRHETMRIDECVSGSNIFIEGVQHYVVSETYTDADTATTRFLDNLYEGVSHEVLAEFYICDDMLYFSKENLINSYLENKQN